MNKYINSKYYFLDYLFVMFIYKFQGGRDIDRDS